MATVIQIKRTTGVSAPTVSDLAEAELAYVQDRSNDGASSKLFIESVDSGANPVVHEVGGKYFTDIIKGSTPTPANLIVGNGATAGASVQFREDSDNGTNSVTLKSPDNVASDVTFTLMGADGSANQVVETDGSGNLSFRTVTSTIDGATDTNLTSVADGSMLLYDTGTSKWIDNVMSGDATMTDGGVLTISALSVETGMIANDAVTLAKIADSVIITESEGIASNDNDTGFPTAAAVKDYVDTNVTAQDLDIAGDSGTGAIDLDSQSLTVQGTANEIETSVSGQTITVGLPDNVTTTGNLTVGGTLNSDDITASTMTASGNVVVSGNLTVNGTTTTVNSSTVNIADPVFEIGSDSSDDNLDRGIKFKYNDGSAKVGFFGMDDSTGKFVALSSATDSSSTFSGTAMNGVFGNLEMVNASLSGSINNYAGSAPTDGQLLIGDTSSGVFDAATLTAGEGIDITNGAGAITIIGEDATTSNKGIASFSAAQVDITSGAVTIKDASTSVKGLASFNSSEFTVSSGAVSITAIDGGTF